MSKMSGLLELKEASPYPLPGGLALIGARRKDRRSG